MIEIIPLKLKDIFDKEYITSLDLIKESNNNCYITSVDLISKLLVIDLPIVNKRLAISNILTFLNYFDTACDERNILVIPSTIFVKFFTTKHYKEYIKVLEDNKIISNIVYKDEEGKPTFKYKVGEASKKYRAYDSYNNSDLCLVVIDSNKRPVLQIEDNLVDKKFVDTISTIGMNYKNAICDEIDNFQSSNMDLNVLRKRISRLLSLRVRRFLKKGIKVDRIYHSFTNLSKISRKHTLINFNNIDIVNCQPLLLCAYLIKNGYDIDNSYKDDCENGLIYERFIYKLPREETKVELYKSIYFYFSKKNEYNKKFKEIYPITWQSLSTISANNISMASILQNFEASLFNNIKPIKSENYYTLFDAVYYDNIMDSSNITNIIKQFFNELGIKVSLKLNDIKI